MANEMKQFIVFIIFTIANGNGNNESHELSDVDYARMPPLYHLDEYDSCLQKTGYTYCTVTFSLKSDEPSDLLTMIIEYSKESGTHFNHSSLRYGLCVTKKCRHQHKNNLTEITESIIAKCLEEEFVEKYNLKTEINEFYCKEFQTNGVNIDIGDILVALSISVIVSMAAIATFIDLCMSDKNTKGNFTLNFSIKRNWFRLMSRNVNESDEGKTIFKHLHGIKFFLFCFVVVGHASIPVVLSGNNVKNIEEIYNHLIPCIILTGGNFMQIFFVISGMLLIYKIQIHEEKNRIDYLLVPKILAHRWLRLTPPYALTIAITSTLFRHIKPGPLWEIGTGLDINDCRQRGWLNVLYLNNYINDSQCLPHSWYLAADMQLFILGIFIHLIVRNTKSKVFAMGVTLIVGMIIPVIHTYVEDLDPIVIASPESFKTFFGNDPTYNKVYKRGHTNISSYVVGLSLGYLIYYLKTNNFTIKPYRKYRLIYWSLLPACILLTLLGRLFFNRIERPSIYFRLIYAMLSKPLLAVFASMLIIGMTFNYEHIYRNILQWKNWMPLSRLSYSAFIVHFVIIRLYLSTTTELIGDDALTNKVQSHIGSYIATHESIKTYNILAGIHNYHKIWLEIYQFHYSKNIYNKCHPLNKVLDENDICARDYTLQVLLLLFFITVSFLAAIPLYIFVEAPITGFLKL